MNVPMYGLSNGVRIPAIGYGTAPADGMRGVDITTAVAQAIEAGYRHIDTAQMYESEDAVGRAVKNSGLVREEFFLTSKLHNAHHTAEKTRASFEETLRKLQTGYLDLFLLHWPNPVSCRDNWKARNAACWRVLETLCDEEKIRAIGVSNFRPHHMAALMETARIQPMVNQIRLFPGDSSIDRATLADCARRGILLEGYSPLGLGAVLTQPALVQIAEKYGKTPAQICLRWSLDKGYLPLPKTLSPARMAENIAVFDFLLAAADIAALDAMPPSMTDDRDPDCATW